MQETILWQRIDLPGHEICRLSTESNGWKLNGTAVFSYKNQPCRFTYLIITKQNWETVSVVVEGQLGARKIELQIENSGSNWHINRSASPEVKGCVDIDLGFSPSTNILPINRLSIPIGGQEEIRAAWLHFPTFKLRPLNQVYARESQKIYRYESRGGDFIRQLTVRPSGFIQEYPGLWKFESAI